MRSMAVLLTGAVVVLALSACAPESTSGQTSTPVSSGSSSLATTGSTSASASPTHQAACTPASMKTRKTGVFTFATDQPVYEPWFVANKPTNGKGFESAVAYAVAEHLGYAGNKVSWVREGFNAAIAPGPKTFDADINEFSITAQRAKAVDFSSGYYDVAQAIVALKGTKAASVKSIAALKSLKLGAQVGTTSYTAITDQIKPSTQPAVYNTNDDAVQALKNGQIDGLVVDLPTAFYVTSAQIKGSTIVGQLPPAGGKPEQFGFVLDKGSSLTACLSKAVNALRKDGTLTRLADRWLSQAGAPKLK